MVVCGYFCTITRTLVFKVVENDPASRLVVLLVERMLLSINRLSFKYKLAVLFH